MKRTLCIIFALISVTARSQVSSSGDIGKAVVLSQCEGPFCFSKSQWTFYNGEGRGVWDGGSLAHLVITRVGANSLTILRTDDNGPSKGLTGVYEGTIHGNKITGSAVWTWSAMHWPNDQASSTWSATIVQGTNAGLVAAKTSTVQTSSPTTFEEAGRPLQQTQTNDHTAQVRSSSPPNVSTDQVLTLRGQASSETYPAGIALCEGSITCWQWDFTGERGVGNIPSMPDPVRATLTIEHLDPHSIVVKREDRTGRFQGLTAIYSGVRQGNWIDGKVDFLWPGGQSIPSNTWHGILRPVALEFPPSGRPASTPSNAELLERTGWFLCEEQGDKCGSTEPHTQYLWVLDRTRGRGRYVADSFAATELTIDELTSNSVLIRRIDRKGTFAGITVMYRGTREGNLMSGAATVIWPGHLNAPTIYNWSARRSPDSCDPLFKPELTYNQSTQIGAIASMRGDFSAQFGCYLSTAKKGDAASQAEVGRMLYLGEGTRRDNGEAFQWLSKGAAQDNTKALYYLSLSYRDGLGTKADHLMARYLMERVDYQEGEQKQHDRTAKSSSALDALGNALGGYLFGEWAKSDVLQDRIRHEETVINYMKGGKSRLEAEQLVYPTEYEARESAHESCIELKMHPSSGFTSSCGRGTGIDCPTRYEAEQKCNEGLYKLEQNRSAEYLSCVRKFSDSEVVEAKCHFSMGER